MKTIDLNCDLGESFGPYKMGMDESGIRFVTSANIACGWHAGDPAVMDRTVKMAADLGVGVGAHPGYPDLLGFGRRNMDCTLEDIQKYVIYQIGALQAFCRVHGVRLRHVKPHGALYSTSVKNESVARAVAQAIVKFDPDLLDDVKIPAAAVVEIPVCYGGEFGPDIGVVGKVHDLTEDEVIRLHSEPEYLIYMVGFTPGFAYLGGLSERLHTPRLATPRMLFPQGSVGIANNQTGMYPVESPGGWQLIGRTPLKLFAPERLNPFLYQAGDKIKFNPISAEKFSELAGKEEG